MLRLLAFLCLFLPVAALAQGLPDPVSDRVNDFAHVLKAEAVSELDALLARERQETKAHVVIVTMGDIVDYGARPEERLADYAKRLFNHWGVGDHGRNDGILILVETASREMRLALGAGYPVIWDNAAQRVIDHFMLPAFREGDYAKGLIAGTRESYAQIVRPWQEGQEAPAPEGGFPYLTLVLGLIGFGLVGSLKKLRRKLTPCSACGKRNLVFKDEVIEPASRQSSGRGITHVTCPDCGHSRSENYSISAVEDDSQESGFGGGSSSGGGASGKW